ncbi:MAG: glycoside hydrolase family 43 protein [Clostridiales bacterium]|nr:glycoside hydrolase family 43 protein [Clostridiales bacterium]
MAKYQNPVVRGCYPDPSVCRRGEWFYLVNSSFEFFPGVPISRSKNLVEWEHIGYCIDREEQLQLSPTLRQSASGIFAPSIRCKDDTFYMVVTNVTEEEKDNGNFYVWTKDPAGAWSDPIFLGTEGIDPSFFFDDDGNDYYIGTSNHQIYICTLDLKEQKITGKRTVIWEGTGGSYPEGPHIYKKSGWYYLLISEGGTERSHMITMARSKQIEGPYEACPYNPVLTNRSLLRPIESVGHADLVEDLNGNWWAVCLGTRTFSYPPKHNLGRETMLVPVNWENDWPVFGNHGSLDQEIETDCLPAKYTYCEKKQDYYCDFTSEKLDQSWNCLYTPQHSFYKTGDGTLQLFGDEHSLCDMAGYAWLGVRQCEHNTKASVELEFKPMAQEEAGLTIFMNHKHHYEAALVLQDGTTKLILRRQIGSLYRIEQEIAVPNDKVTLELESDLDNYTFYYRLEDGKRKLLGKGETVYLTTEVGGSFTGNYIALYAMGNGKNCSSPAKFSNFTYKEI